MNIDTNLPSNPKIGDKGSIIVTIPMKDILDILGVVSVTETSFTAMLKVAREFMEKALRKGISVPSLVTSLALSIGTSIVQMVFDADIEPVRIKVTTKMEYQNVEYTQQGLTVHVPSWNVVDRTIKLLAS